LPEKDAGVFGEGFETAERGFEFGGGNFVQHFAEELRVED
jgi:hypothetical protein